VERVAALTAVLLVGIVVQEGGEVFEEDVVMGPFTVCGGVLG